MVLGSKSFFKSMMGSKKTVQGAWCRVHGEPWAAPVPGYIFIESFMKMTHGRLSQNRTPKK
jgi:hypothetical protein